MKTASSGSLFNSYNEACITVSHASCDAGAEGKGDWLVDSGATCHMCDDKEQFSELSQLSLLLLVMEVS